MGSCDRRVRASVAMAALSYALYSAIAAGSLVVPRGGSGEALVVGEGDAEDDVLREPLVWPLAYPLI